MKPSWSDAPEWANFLARDSEGIWWWFDKEPAQGVMEWEPEDYSMVEIALNPHEPHWAGTLEKRP